MTKATLSISSKNYSSWSLRGWLLAKFAKLAFEESVVPPDDADARKEILLLSPSILVNCAECWVRCSRWPIGKCVRPAGSSPAAAVSAGVSAW